MTLKTSESVATAANPIHESSPHGRGLPDRVAQLYYAHGLFCSTHPIPVLAIALTVVLAFCFPLANIPLPGTVPQQYQSPRVNWTFDTGSGYTGFTNNNGPTISSSASLPPPRWFDSAPPFCYVQQVIIRTAVSPWETDLSLGDAFRAPLSTVFDLLQTIGDYQQPNATRSLAHVCLHVEGLRPGSSSVFPEFGCLVLSPAILWRRDRALFAEDADLLGTVLSYQGLQKGRPTIAEMAFGMHMKETGVKRYPVRIRQRILQYAVTLFLSEYEPSWISGLANRLSTLYPLHRGPVAAHGPWLHLYFPGELRLAELLPLAATYFCLFLYVYFSVRKIALVRSKVGMALSALIMCAASLAISVGACFFFGLTLSPGTEIFPYLVVVVGLENILVLTKSVLATQPHLDAKIRVAQGLSREGWSITKNLLSEVTVLTLGLCTFVPAIQELCIFAVVGLISDFFLQMMFFAPVLALAVRSAAESDDAYLYDPSRSIRTGMSMSGRVAHDLHNSGRGGGTYDIGGGNTGRGLSRSRSSPRLSSSYQTTSVNNPTSSDRVPKRLRLVQIWAKTRFFQRSFMIAMMMWIGVIAYNAGLVQSFLAKPSSSSAASHSQTTPPTAEYLVVPNIHRTASISENSSNAEPKLRHWPWWPAPPAELIASILAQYNVTSLAGRYVTVLAPMRLAVAVPPTEARNQRHPKEPGPSQSEFRWAALAAALDPLDIADAALVATSGSSPDLDPAELLNLEEHQARHTRAPYVPNSPMELFLSALLGLISLGVVLYTLVALYRCICPRNYAEWRSNWWSSSNNDDRSKQVVMESVPIVLDGHPQDIECLAADPCTPLIVSSCLAGQVRVWDSVSGQLVTAINRRSMEISRGSDQWTCNEMGGGPLSDYESGSPPSRGDPGGNNGSSSNINCLTSGLPDLSPAIDTNFGGLRIRTQIATSNNNLSNESSELTNKEIRSNGFDFGPHIKKLFSEKDYLSNPVPSTTTFQLSSVEQLNTPPASPPLPPPAQAPAIWALDLHDGLLALGCSDGSVEFWDAASGHFKGQFSDGFGEEGVTGIRVCGSRVAVARLSGALDLLRLDRIPPSANNIIPVTSASAAAASSSSLPGSGNVMSTKTPALHRHGPKRGHLRTGSAGSTTGILSVADEMRCSRIALVPAHQQPISVLEADGARGIVVTGSCDHSLRAWRLLDAQPLYTLHGHLGPVTALVIDRAPLAAASAAKDGSLCLWELHPQSGACVASVQAHPTAILALASAPSYVVTLGAEQRLCVWERFQGHLLHAMQLWPMHGTPLCSSLAMLTPTLVVTSGPRDQSLAIWDVASGDQEPIRLVPFGVTGESGTPSSVGEVATPSSSAHVLRQIVAASCRDAVLICDLGTQLRLVRFHSLADKQQ